MSLLVYNVISSSSEINYSYLGSQEIFGYLISLNYTLNVQDINFDNNDGVLLSGRTAIRQAYKQRNITARIGGDEILNGEIVSLSFDESSLTGEDTVTITIIERRRLSDYSSKTFAKYIPSPHLLEDFSETYSFSRSGSSYTYDRNISIKYAQDAGDQFLKKTKDFLTHYYYENRPAIGYYEDGISENARFNKGFNVGTLNETIDLVNLSVSLQENFQSSFIEEVNNVSKIKTESYSIDTGGFLTKTINVSLTSLRYDSQNVLQEAIGNTIDDIVADEAIQFGNPISIQKGITKDSSKANVSLQFSANPTTSETNIVTYQCSKQKQGSFVDYTLSVNYMSKGKNNQDKYNNLLATWDGAKSDNEAKVIALFSEANGEIYEKSRSIQISKTKGTVSESIVYTTQEIYDVSGLPDGIIKFGITTNKTQKVNRTTPVLDLETLKQKLVVSSQKTLGQATVTATAVAQPFYGMFYAKHFLQSKTDDMNAALGEDTYYGTSDKISIDLSSGTTTRVIQYIIA